MSQLVRKLIDIGANLTDPMFRGVYHSTKKHDDDFGAMLHRARASGIDKIIITGGSLIDSKSALDTSKLSDMLYSTVGVHPTRCEEFNTFEGGPSAYLEELKKLALSDRDKIVAIGELGLDYDRLHFCPKETQKLYFEKQLQLVPDLELPLFLHNRNSTDDFVDILSRNRHMFAARNGVVHSFDGSQKDLERVLDLGLYIGINGCSLKTEENLEVVKMIPNDRLLIETDCPWCEIRPSHSSFKHVKTKFSKTKDASDPKLPVKNRSEPLYLIQVLEVLASVRNQNLDELSNHVYENTIKLFFGK